MTVGQAGNECILVEMDDERLSLADSPGLSPPQRTWIVPALWVTACGLAVLAAAAIYINFRALPFDPAAWRTAGGLERARMLSSLLQQTDFNGFSRPEVEYYLGVPEFDERLFWYDLGEYDATVPIDPRGDVGSRDRLYGVFRQDPGGTIQEVVFSHRRPVLGSDFFDSTLWFSDARAERQRIFTRALGRLRALGLSRANTAAFLGPPDGWRVRSEYNVGRPGRFFGGHRALVIEFDAADTVRASFLAD